MKPSPLRPPLEDGAAVIQNRNDRLQPLPPSSFASLTLKQVASGYPTTLASVLQSPVEESTHPPLHNPTNSSPTTLGPGKKSRILFGGAKIIEAK